MKAETIAKALGGRKVGGGWMARCPAHEDRNPSLSLHDADDGKVLVRCHAGCDQGRVIGALRSRGLYRQFRCSAPRTVANNQPDRDDAKRSEAALAIWQSATPAGGTLVEPYLVSRGLHLPPPPTLRFHTGLRLIGEGIETCLAAMLATGCPAWAALSTSGLRALDLPNDVREVIVLADGDDPGEAAPQECARRWKREGRRVRIARPREWISTIC
jgi:Toprim domain-containing protein